MDIVKCRYAKCICKDKELTRENAVRVNSSYYHPDCYELKQKIAEITELFTSYVKTRPVYSQLVAVINSILFDKNISADYLLFGLRYYVNHRITLRYPQGLYYVIQNDDVRTAYNKLQSDKITRQMENNTQEEYVETSNRTFGYTSNKPKTILDILGE